VIATKRIYPDRYKRRTVRFTPSSRPSPAQVHRIIALEARRWNISEWALSRRVGCESGYRWWAANGQYHGLGQFASSTFSRGLSTMPRGVVFKRSRVLRRHTRYVRVYASGRRKGVWGYAVKVRRTRVYRGRISRPDWLHGWAQLRIMAQAIAGRSAVHDSEWECR
jgi:hypothetical protein